MRLLALIISMNVVTGTFAANHTIIPEDTGRIQHRFCPAGFRPVLFSYNYAIVDGKRLNLKFSGINMKHRNNWRLIQPLRDRMDKVLTVMGGGMLIGIFVGKIFGYFRYRNNPNISDAANDRLRGESAILSGAIGLIAGGVSFGLYELIFGN
ncbi:MAG TPA: hypothetical protein VGD17_19320 [Chitinophagaceae bacterium]